MSRISILITQLAYGIISGLFCQFDWATNFLFLCVYSIAITSSAIYTICVGVVLVRWITIKSIYYYRSALIVGNGRERENQNNFDSFEYFWFEYFYLVPLIFKFAIVFLRITSRIGWHQAISIWIRLSAWNIAWFCMLQLVVCMIVVFLLFLLLLFNG